MDKCQKLFKILLKQFAWYQIIQYVEKLVLVLDFIVSFWFYKDIEIFNKK